MKDKIWSRSGTLEAITTVNETAVSAVVPEFGISFTISILSTASGAGFEDSFMSAIDFEGVGDGKESSDNEEFHNFLLYDYKRPQEIKDLITIFVKILQKIVEHSNPYE